MGDKNDNDKAYKVIEELLGVEFDYGNRPLRDLDDPIQPPLVPEGRLAMIVLPDNAIIRSDQIVGGDVEENNWPPGFALTIRTEQHTSHEILFESKKEAFLAAAYIFNAAYWVVNIAGFMSAGEKDEEED